MVSRSDVKNFGRVVLVVGLVSVLYLLASGGTPYYSGLGGFSAPASEQLGRVATLQQTCTPLATKRLSPDVAAAATEYIHMMPRPKRVSYPSGARRPGAEAVLSYAHAVSLSVSIDPMLPDEISSGVDESFWLDRLCAQSRSFPESRGAARESVVNGTLVEHIDAVEIFIVSNATYASVWGGERVPEDAVAAAYTLDIGGGVIRIYTTGAYGLRHALSSTAQLMENPSALQLPLRLVDWPSYHWRGIMVDVARHFMPIRKLYRLLDAMHSVKMNYLHIHLTDSQSFPVLLEDTEDLPLSQLGRQGSFRPNEVYSLSDLGNLVAYANQLGIDVVPEVDVPAHTKAWAKGFPDIVVQCPVAEKRGSGASQSDIPTLDISNPKVLRIIESILQQLTKVFTSEFIHVGGDEIHTDCWDESENMTSFKQKKSSSWIALLQDFEGSVFDMVYRLHKTPIIWQGVQDMRAVPTAENMQAPPGRVIVQPWKCWGGLSGAAAMAAGKAGRNVIVSACMYLDWDVEWDALLSVEALNTAAKMARPLSVKGLEAKRRLLNDKAISNSLIMFTISETENKRASLKLDRDSSDSSMRRLQSAVLGGEVALWSERIDFSNLECRMWPRAAASAAVLWGFPPFQDSDEGSYAYSLASKNRFPRNSDSSQSDNAPFVKYYKTALGQNHWLASYSFIEQFLRKVIRVHPSVITVHKNYSESCITERSLSGSIASGLTPIPYSDTNSLFAYLNEELTCSQQHQLTYRLPIISSQCQMLPAHMHVPVVDAPPPESGANSFRHRLRGGELDSSDNSFNVQLKITFLNIENGGFPGDRSELLDKWLYDRALFGDSIIGLAEVNKWQHVRNSNNRKFNFEDIVFRAASAGFTYSHMISSEAHPYSLGLVSVFPFIVVAEYGPPNLLRLMLHVYFESFDIHVIVAHLTPHSSSARTAEVLYIQDKLKQLFAENGKIVLMGDLNTLSPFEQCALSYSNCGGVANDTLLDDISTNYQFPVYKRLIEKYCTYSGSTGMLEIDYNPFNVLQDLGFVETCDLMCRSSMGYPTVEELRNESYVECMLSSCGYSEPTMYNPEWPSTLRKPAPKLKVDNILISRSVASRLLSTEGVVPNYDQQAGQYFLNASVLRSNVTDVLSDHYPVHVEFRIFCPSRFWRRQK